MRSIRTSLFSLGLLIAVMPGSVQAIANPTVYESMSGDSATECAVVGDYAFSYKFDPVSNSTQTESGNTITLENVVGNSFDWNATSGIGAVIVKAGPGAHVWNYTPPAAADTGLYSPQPDSISHITFCWNYSLEVSKTAETSYDQPWDWTITKSADPKDFTLKQGESQIVSYEISVDPSMSAAENFLVKGTVTIHNPAPIAATITSVIDSIKIEELAPDTVLLSACKVDDEGVSVSSNMNYSLLSGKTLACDYEYETTGIVTGENTVAVQTTGDVGGATAKAPFDFAEAEVGDINEQIVVTDSMNEALEETVSAVAEFAEWPYVIEYEITFYADDLECGLNEIPNTARFVSTTDEEFLGEAEETVSITLECILGCTLTQGYWKTHSKYGPAPEDEQWGELADAAFFHSGKTYYDVLWTAPAGNAYYVLAHQYIAAELNEMAGAEFPTDVKTAFDEATELLGDYSPNDIAKLKGKSGNIERANWTRLASILDDFNNGLLGVPHCDAQTEPEPEDMLITAETEVMVAATVVETEASQPTEPSLQTEPSQEPVRVVTTQPEPVIAPPAVIFESFQKSLPNGKVKLR